MEIQDFAKTILWGSSLADKLVSPLVLTDLQPGDALESVDVRLPGRPATLSLARWHTRPRVAFPEGPALEKETGRGCALHFFANHELLALELMALALLRFPDAPPAFRRGLVSTMREEQEHMRLYMDRMNALGVGFGEIPVNDFFWQTISSMASPHDFVVRMSLTFEQANLDFALAYMHAFARTGDEVTAALMRKVYDDEVGHVRHGLAWHRQWKNPGEDDWEAFVRALPPELTPARAKGSRYSESARHEAGFDENFVRALGLFSQSKGRPPRVWVFRPTVESDWAASAAGRATLGNPSDAVRALTHDFDWVPAFVAAHDDIVLVEQKPSAAFLSDLRLCGFHTPEAVTQEARRAGAFKARKLGGLAPWGWSEACAREHADVMRASKETGQGAGAHAAKLGAKPALIALESRLLENPLLVDAFSLCDTNFHAPTAVRSLGEVEAILASRPVESCFVLKAAHTSSGRDRVFPSRSLGELEATKGRAWMEKRFAAGETLLLEPLLDRVADFSVQFTAYEPGRVKVHGVSRFVCDAVGRYLGAALGRKSAGLPPEVVRFLYAGTGGRDVFSLLAEIGGEVALLCAQEGYVGPGGFDAFLYRHPGAAGGLALRPLVDLNPRLTMGRIALELQRRLVPQAVGVWLHLNTADSAAAGCATLLEFADRIRVEFGLAVTRPGSKPGSHTQHPPLLTSGALFTNDPALAQRFLSVMLVAQHENRLHEHAARVSDRLAERVRAFFGAPRCAP